jgi:very-short-patch-repair endonuclease
MAFYIDKNWLINNGLVSNGKTTPYNPKLIIEIDGSYHYDNDQFQYDQIRSDRLSIYNLSVIRFNNNEILNAFNNACKTINNLLIPPS